jgi:hypothetical protein
MLRRAGVGALEHPAPMEISMKFFLLLNLLVYLLPWLCGIVLCALIIAAYRKRKR